MKRHPRTLTSQMERLIETALAPGRFVSDGANFSFVSELGTAEHEIAKLIPTAPAQAVALYETFLAGCYEKAEEIDDSSGSFGQFVDELYCGWIKARQAAGADPDETATRLLGWMEDDPYGFCYHLEKDAVKVLNKAGRAAFVKQIRERFDAAATAEPVPGESSRRNPDYARRQWGGSLRTLYLEQKNVEAYRALAEETGTTAEDCQALATLLVARRKAGEALSWVERGIELVKKAPHGSMAEHDLDTLKRDLLTKLGRGDEALEAAWAEYREHPSKYSYDDLMKYVPKDERAAWHEKAIEAATGADLHAQIELLLETKELDRLAELVRRSTDDALEDVSHYTTEPAARKLEKAHPDLAARLWCAQGMRVVNAKKSKYYGAALSNFERARRCFEKAGLTADWQGVVEKVRSEHHRKTGFMAGFEEIVAGSGPSKKPSFLERAKARWGARQPGDGQEAASPSRGQPVRGQWDREEGTRMSRAGRDDENLADLDELLGKITVDAHGDDETLWALRQAFEDDVTLPADGFVIGEPVSVTEIDYDGNERRGLTARCRREDGSEHVVTATDVVFPQGSSGARHVAAYRKWLGLDPYPPETSGTTQRKRQHKATAEDLDLSGPVELVVLAVKERAARCRLLRSDRAITLRASELWDMVPGEIVTVKPRKQWSYAGHPYLSGDIESTRLDVRALGLVPLRLEDMGTWDPKEHYWGEEDEPIEEWAKPIIARGPRPGFEMEQVLPSRDPDDPFADPVTESNDLKDAGERAEAHKILMELCQADLRCLDAHAHLGNFVFDHSPEEAIRHYEVGLRIGELSLGDGFGAVLPWGHIDNRPFLRCMHGYGLCLWRLGRYDEAGRVFEKMLWLNPSDNQGVRFLVDEVRAGKAWEENRDQR